MLIPVIGALIGIMIGILLPFEIPLNFVKYTAIAILAAVDAIFGGVRAQVNNRFMVYKFISSFFTNASLAALLAYLGDILGVDIYMGALVAFSIRIFNNLSVIREELFDYFWNWCHPQPKVTGKK